MIQTFHALFNKNSDVNTDDDVVVLLEIFVNSEIMKSEKQKACKNIVLTPSSSAALLISKRECNNIKCCNVLMQMQTSSYLLMM